MSIAKHDAGREVFSVRGAVTTSVHDKERRIAVTEIVVVVALVNPIVVAVSIVKLECTRCVEERSLEVVTISSKIVDKLRMSNLVGFKKGELNTSWSS